MPRRSRPSGRPSTTSLRTNKDRILSRLRRRSPAAQREAGPFGAAPQEPKSLLELIEGLPAQRAEAVFTHASWAADRTLSYERLEFLGDSVLELAMARTLFDRYPEFSEGRMAKVRSHVVSRASCAIVARELELGERMRTAAAGLAKEEVDRLARNKNVLAALLEAALAAVYLEHGFEAVEPAVVAAFESQLEYALNTYVDHKTELQERLARLGLSVSYATLTMEGPPHDRSFTAAAIIDGEVVGTGEGRSKKDAEQAAAEQALVDVPAPAS